MKVSDNALEIMRERVLLKGETPDEMVRRVIKAVAAGDVDAEKRYIEVMDSKYFLPNSPCLSNAGTPVGQLSACFVLPIEDSMESIMQTLYDASMIQKTGGGTGFTFTHIRPDGSLVKTTGGKASGPVSFMRMYDSVMEEIEQGGKRKGASLGTLNCDHKDILKFIRCKLDQTQLNNFNISVGAFDKFMEDVVAGDGEALKIWKELVYCAWATGDPGLLFLDTINKHNPLPWLGRIETCNPCGEVGLLPYESCVLGSINLSKMVDNGEINYLRLTTTTCIAVDFLDSVIDRNVYPLKKIEKATKLTRKIGIGIMGLADMFFMLGIRYGSKKSYELADNVMKHINDTAIGRSMWLAKAKGVYPAHRDGLPKRRNATVTSIAPTGTIAAIAGTTFSAEPEFALVYTKTILDGKEFYEVNPIFQAELERRGLNRPEIIEKVLQNNGSVKGLKEIPQDMQSVFVTAHDLHWKDHINMQSVLQLDVEQSISKTINLPSTATVDDVSDIYIQAWKSGCKGVTIYRDGSKDGQVFTTKKHRPSERPRDLHGTTSKFKTGCGSLYVTVNKDSKGDPHEVFANHSDRNGCVNTLLNALAMVASISLRSGVSPKDLSDAMAGHMCGWCDDVKSCADAVGEALSSFIQTEGESDDAFNLKEIPTNEVAVCNIGGGCLTCG